MNAPAIRQQVKDRAAREIRELHDGIDRLCQNLAHRGAFTKADGPLSYTDAQVAPIYAEQLRYKYSQIPEVLYAELEAANGEVLPIDSSMPPAAVSWEYDMIDSGAMADWIDDEGHIAPSAFVKSAGKFTGKAAEFGMGYESNLFDDERAVMAGLPLDTIKGQDLKRAHDAFCQWHWLFGTPEKDGMPGLCTHPMLITSLAALNGGASSRLIGNKSDAEILADFRTLIDAVPHQSKRRHFAVEVWLPHTFIEEMRSRFIASTAAGTFTLWDRLKAMYSGDDAGQPRVSFKPAMFCEAANRLNPNTGTDTSNISGDFVLALPAKNAAELCFIRARPFTMRPPREVGDFTIKHVAHAKIGGCKMVRPLSLHMMVYGTT
jgi:hypothetical protein